MPSNLRCSPSRTVYRAATRTTDSGATRELSFDAPRAVAAMSAASGSHPGAANATSPPSKRDLRSWWKGFKLPSKHQESQGTTHSSRVSQVPHRIQQPVFSEDVQDRVDTALHPLAHVLQMQDAHVTAKASVVSSEAPAVWHLNPAPADKVPDPSPSFFHRRLHASRPAHAIPTVKTKTKEASTDTRSPGIFGVPLRQSITYANVAISLIDENGQSYIYGYVPIVVAKCGVYLKEKGELSCRSCSPFVLVLTLASSNRHRGHLSSQRLGEAHQGAENHIRLTRSIRQGLGLGRLHRARCCKRPATIPQRPA